MKNSMFKRIVIIYSLVIIALGGISAVVVGSFVFSVIKNNELSKVEKDVALFESAILTYNQSSQILFQNTLESNEAYDDLQAFVTYPTNEYLERRLEKYTNRSEFVYPGFFRLLQNTVYTNSATNSIYVYSHIQQEVSAFTRNNQRVLGSLEVKGDINTWSQISDFISEKREISKSYLSYFDVKDQVTGIYIGTIVVEYTMPAREFVKGCIFTRDGQNQLMYDDCENTNLTQKYSLEEMKRTNLVFTNYYSTTASVKGTQIYGLLSGGLIWEASFFYLLGVVLLTCIIIAMSEYVLYKSLLGFRTRTNKILGAIDALNQGDFSTQIRLDKEADELTEISRNFNVMVKQLDMSINEVYKLELLQKNTEIKMLQSQINPHFLYNTLEVIRMKAIINKDEEVGEMLYQLATLFRTIVKGGTFTTVKEELLLCKQYLALFSVRFPNTFTYDISCEEVVEDIEIVKFLLQPIIENSLKHGLDFTRNNNRITIHVMLAKELLRIELTDNGVGINKVKMEALEQGIFAEDSIGLQNIYERVSLYYGKKARVIIASNNPGTKVTITIPYDKKTHTIGGNQGEI